VAFVVLGAAVGTWYVVSPHLPLLSVWPEIAIVALAVLPATLALALVALPLWPSRWMFPAAVVLVLVAVGTWQADWKLAANFAKLVAFVFAGWAFLRLFEEVSWIVIVALLVPFVDALSVFVPQGPTHEITSHHVEIYNAVAVVFLGTGDRGIQLGPPDVLFYALFLAAAARWRLRPGWTWFATTGMYALTVVTAQLADVNGLPALPFLSCGFLLANGDLLWRRLRPRPAR
jgi:hypothetical protein